MAIIWEPMALLLLPEFLSEISTLAETLTPNWQFALFKRDGSHYAAVSVESNENTAGSRSNPDASLC